MEKDLSKVHAGQPIQFSIQEDSSRQYEATVHLVNKNVDHDNRTIGIHGHLLDTKLNDKFNPGMYVEADIYTASETKASLPQEALVDVDGQFYVLVLASSSDGNQRFKKKEVKTGFSSKGYVEILNTEDFNSETEFLIDGAFNLITE
jgi:cobalt-zinc-cadmium efflux system membrane fusion protein